MATVNIDVIRLANALNDLDLEGVVFRPIHFKPYYMPKKGIPHQGVQIHLTDPAKVVLTEIQFWFLQEAHNIDPSFILLKTGRTVTPCLIMYVAPIRFGLP